LNSENVKIPKKLFKNPVSQHSTQEKELRKEMGLKNCEYEIKRLKLVADIKNKVVKEIDDEISDFYNAHYNSEEGDRRKHRWREMVEGEEQTSKVIWQKKRSFFNSERHMISINSESKSVYKQLHSSNFHNRCMYNKKHNNVTKRNDNSNRNCRNVNYNWRVQQYNKENELMNHNENNWRTSNRNNDPYNGHNYYDNYNYLNFTNKPAFYDRKISYRRLF